LNFECIIGLVYNPQIEERRLGGWTRGIGHIKGPEPAEKHETKGRWRRQVPGGDARRCGRLHRFADRRAGADRQTQRPYSAGLHSRYMARLEADQVARGTGGPDAGGLDGW